MMSAAATIRSVLLGLVAAFTAGIGVMLIVLQLFRAPSWDSESIIAALTAAAWMTAGLAIRQRTAIAATIIFAPGAMVAWFLSRGIVHSISPYYGLVPFGAACLGAAIAWSVRVRRDGPTLRLAAMGIPALTFVGATAATLAAPDVGMKRNLSDAHGDREVFMLPAPSWDYWLWASASNPLSPHADSTVLFEPDPGSGAGRYRITQIRDEAAIGTICAQFRASRQQRLESEINEGSTPRFITRLPARSVDCEGGTVWQTVR